MKFSRRVFAGAGLWGLLVVSPLYFLYDIIGRKNPPAITHPEFFYGFLGVTVAWQLAFFVIASDPVRFRALMVPAMVEKFGYVTTLIVLQVQSRLSADQWVFVSPDLLWGVLFVVAFFKVKAWAPPSDQRNLTIVKSLSEAGEKPAR